MRKNYQHTHSQTKLNATLTEHDFAYYRRYTERIPQADVQAAYLAAELVRTINAHEVPNPRQLARLSVIGRQVKPRTAELITEYLDGAPTDIKALRRIVKTAREGRL